ncbi:MAG: TonB-dependent receptor [Terriglobia bacterium]
MARLISRTTRFGAGISHRAAAEGASAKLLSVLLLGILAAVPAFGQRERSELRLSVQDARGVPIAATASLVSEANHVRRTFQTRPDGRYASRDLPFGVYRLSVSHQGFSPASRLVDVRSEVPVSVSVTLSVAPVRTQVRVPDSATLIDPERTGVVYSIGSRAAQEELPVQLGRGLSNLVDSEPGWLYEANGVLHPRGSEYDVQYVVNGLPFTENRSPAFTPPFESEDVESMRVMTAGFPAEYGRKLGGVVEITTPESQIPGLHLTAVAQGGSFSSVSGYLGLGYARGRSQFMLTGNAGATDRYLDPPVVDNYTNAGSTGAFTGSYSLDVNPRNRLHVSVMHDDLRYEVPNELVQQEAGQRQDAASGATSGQADYDLILSPSLLFSAEGSVRDESFRLWSNDRALPVIVGQQRGFREGYARLTLAGARGKHDWKVGTDAIFDPVHEALQYNISEPTLFDPGTALNFSFRDRRTAIEPSAFAEDSIHWNDWNVSAGLRYDEYRFVVTQSAWSPRLSISHYFESAGLLVHASYDRVFQTPAIENLLLASSPELSQVSSLVLRLSVQPSRGDYYEIGVTRGFWGNLRFNANLFRRNLRNYSDDDTLLDTGVSFPIADASAWIEGIEGKLEVPDWGRFSGFVSYANQEGVGQGPITGGLFIGTQALATVRDNRRFWISQDQRNTAHAHLRFDATKALWLAADAAYGSGLPVERDTGDTSYSFLLRQYGQRVLNEVDFARGRVRPSYSLGASAGIDLYSKENKAIRVEMEGSNLTNHFNVINFASLFSGTAIGVPRSFSVALKLTY